MSKLSFRARQLDAYKAMPIYRSEEIPEVTDVAAINRAVPQMPTGMEKEEETEHHLQRALSAQQVYGTSEALVIPIPDIDDARRHYEQLYPTDYKPPRQYIRAQTYGVDQEVPDYDIDSEDETWLEHQSKKMEITPEIFERMIDRLEKGSGQQVVELKDAKVLLKEDDDLTITVYDYWLNKRLKYTPHALIPVVKCEKRDGSTTNNPYVAFRRRTEKMQTRKNRKNDEVSYEKMLKLRRDLQRAVLVLEMIKKREKCKKELLQLSLDILDKRYDMEDYLGSHLSYAEAQKAPRSVFYPLYPDQHSKEGVDQSSRKMKRKYEKKKHKSSSSQLHGEVDVIEYGSTEDEPLSPVISLSDQEGEGHPDGIFAFRRKKFCNYHAALDVSTSTPQKRREQAAGPTDKKFRYTMTSISTGPESRRCIGYARRRRGRGGRILLDRAYPEQRSDFWDRTLEASIDPSLLTNKSQRVPSDSTCADQLTDKPSDVPTFHDYMTENKWLHFTSVDSWDSTSALFNGALADLTSHPLTDSLDPFIDIIPEPVSGSLPSAFPLATPTVTMPTVDATSLPSTALLSDKQTSNGRTNTDVTSTQLDSKLVTALNFEPHNQQLQTLKEYQQKCNSMSSNSALGNAKSGDPCTEQEGSNHLLASPTVSYAISTFFNGPSVLRGNGIKHLNGPTSKELMQAELTSGNVTMNSLCKVGYPLSPSTDADVPTSMVSGLIQIASLPGDSNDRLSSHNRLVSSKDLTDSSALGAIADVVTTMEVT